MKVSNFLGCVLYSIGVITFIAVIWIMGKLFADVISDTTIITPVPGIECVVVSRIFNTSVDCWTVPVSQVNQTKGFIMIKSIFIMFVAVTIVLATFIIVSPLTIVVPG